MDDTWLKRNTFHYKDFQDIERLVAVKAEKGLTISLCLPTLNEEKTIGKEIVILRSELMTRFPLIDEIVVVDSGSTDRTGDVARAFGAAFYRADDILPELGPRRGKGENLWKALYITRGDIIVYLDADIKNIHHRFAYGLIGPLVLNDRIRYAKAFYDRPIATGKNIIRPTGGGRVTELVIRPLFSIYFPELTQILQPLSGEYAAYRDILEQVPFPIGYGIETSLILDICQRWGMDVICQVDLEKRIHRNQDTKALGKMAFVVMRTFFRRLNRLGALSPGTPMHNQMIQYRLVGDAYVPEPFTCDGFERPPMIDVPAYQCKFGRRRAAGENPEENGPGLDKTDGRD
jgi:glucosyl-3-phosphoglycerate synthase